MDVLLDTVINQKKIDNHIVHDCVENVVVAKMTKDQEEADEIRKRRTSVIIHGLRHLQKTVRMKEKQTTRANLLTYFMK